MRGCFADDGTNAVRTCRGVSSMYTYIRKSERERLSEREREGERKNSACVYGFACLGMSSCFLTQQSRATFFTYSILSSLYVSLSVIAVFVISSNAIFVFYPHFLLSLSFSSFSRFPLIENENYGIKGRQRKIWRKILCACIHIYIYVCIMSLRFHFKWPEVEWVCPSVRCNFNTSYHNHHNNARLSFCSNEHIIR